MQHHWSTKHSLLAAAFIMAVIIAGIYALGEAEEARYLESERQQLYQELDDHRARLISILNSQMQLPLGLAAYVSRRGDVEPQIFRDMAASLLAHSRGMIAIELARDNHLSHLYPMQGNEKALGLDLLSLPEQSVAVRRAMASRRSVLFGPRRLVQGGTAIIGQTPIYVPAAKGNRYWGLAIALMDMRFMLNEAGLLAEHKGMRTFLYRIDADGSRHAIHGDKAVLQEQPITVDIDVLQSRWKLAAVPTEGWAALHSPNRMAINLLGALLAIVASLLFWYLLRTPISLQRQASRTTLALEASEARFAAMSQSVPLPVTITRFDTGEVLYANPAAARFFAVPQATLAGRSVHDFFVSRRDELRLHATLKASGHSEGFEAQVHRSADDTPWVVLHSRLVDMDGEQVMICTFLDISERVEAGVLLERRVRERTDELQRANARLEQEMQERQHLSDQLLQAQKMESVGIMAGGIAHDFNNLLVGIMGSAELAKMELHLSAGMREHLERILKSSLRGKELVSQMLAYSGKGKFISHMIDLSELATEMTQLLHTVISKKARLELALEEHMPAIEGDPNQISQLIMNLITNASDALEGKKGTIRISAGTVMIDRGELQQLYFHAGMQQGSYAFIEVQDSGCGVEEDAIDKIFDPFFTTKFEGSGLGLAALMGIVRGHHGGILIDTASGKGTTFRILFPVATVQSAPAEDIVDTSVPLTLQGTALVVDDEPIIREVTKKMLEQCGMQVLLAENGKEGIRQFRAARDEVAVVLLDRTMPEMSGSEAFAELRRMRADIPVLMISGYTEEDVEIDQPATAFLHKPFTQEDLIEALARLLDRVAT